MKFPYRKQPTNDPLRSWVSRPEILVRLFYQDKFALLFALIDSGAEVTIFNSSIAKDLGIEVEAGRWGTIYGVSGEGINAYFHRIKLQIDGMPDPIETEVGFVDLPRVGGLLGRSGFFEHYHIKFEQDKERVDITPIRKKKKEEQ